jgi:hypothetical protein
VHYLLQVGFVTLRYFFICHSGLTSLYLSSPPSPPIVLWLHALASEFRRPAVMAAAPIDSIRQPSLLHISSRVHRVFERALQTPARSLVALWRMYIRGLLQGGKIESAHKVVLYCASVQLPVITHFLSYMNQ